MRGFVNDVLRRFIGLSLVGFGVVLEVRQRIALATYRVAQARLRARYAIGDATPVLPYGTEQKANIAAAALRYRGALHYALTSGSTAEPKRILYPHERLAAAKRAFIDAFARGFVHTPLRRHSFYMFSSLHQDHSLTSLMMVESRRPSFVEVLQAPYRAQSEPALQDLAARYGDAALRVWVLALSNPGVLYSTNPSTLAVFLDALRDDWRTVTSLVRDFVRTPERLDAIVHAQARRLASPGATSRLRRIASSDTPLPLDEIAPGVHTYVCWTGGYVRPFLERLTHHLPAHRYRLLPMYSMSTETPETTPCYRGESVAFVPLAPGVLYEFLPDDAPDEPSHLLAASELAVGSSYTMVVSDAYGLTRYQTDDVFECVGVVDGLPDLRFRRRRSLSYSFTGEKLTGEHARLALDRLRDEMSGLARDDFLTIMPADDPGGQPHYVLICVLHAERHADINTNAAAGSCDAILAEINAEYRAKRASQRLGAMRAVAVSLEDFLAQVGGAQRDSWEAQFKFLPLYARLWRSP